MAYTPKPGSLAERLLQIMEELPEGTVLSQTELAAAAQCDSRDVRAAAAALLRHGQLVAHTGDDGVPRWKCGLVGPDESVPTTLCGNSLPAPFLAASSVFALGQTMALQGEPA